MGGGDGRVGGRLGSGGIEKGFVSLCGEFELERQIMLASSKSLTKTRT
jgi:hypothetical protein